ncbi:pyridine nucleotide-disulfide oxidoreductase domain-containing protein 1-like isoform X2 [Argiope bruennichi]|uniref:pyridine nucleotide-disulfide oxidoreductase domain-containing protein 1-like isoform X2 n=1 Tax=Argiope bruennichi TaxID=94029 RepID=UPI002494E45C|nr:pyridine nucleotide-disulfide oxidoreductase domain-containing protein 1-like isoform X2 [Argiope bruennichi]
MASSLENSVFETTFAIIGGGIAGVSCAEQLAIEDPEGSVILISASPLVKVARNINKISERLEEFDVEEETHAYLEKCHPNCKVINSSAIEINDERHEIHLSNRQIVRYKRLCICSGAVPKVIAKSSPFVLGIRDTETVEVFQKRLSAAKRVLIVGNGGIAIELVYEIENCQIIWAIKDKSVGATFFDAGAANFFLPCLKEGKQEGPTVSKRLKYELEGDSHPESVMGSALGPDWSMHVNLKGKMERRNIHIEYECEIKAVYEREEFLKIKREISAEKTEDSWPVFAELTNGKIHGCDFIISATGVVPNTGLLQKNKFDFATDGGIKVNDQMKTNLEHIFAAGDVCTASWSLSKHWFQMRLWTQARQMGAYAAKCMACDMRGETAILDVCFDLFTHVTKFFGYKVVLLGLYNGQKLGTDYEIIVRSSERTEYVKVVMQDGRMQGAVLVGETDLEETFENLIHNALDLSVYGEDILNPDIDIEDYFD